MAALYVNRSAAHYALGNYYRCIDDCSKVMEIAINLMYTKYFLEIFPKFKKCERTQRIKKNKDLII